MPDYKPILFNDDMVKAILEGRKTQTRRIVKPKGRLAEEGYIVVDEGKSRQFMPGYLSFCVSDWISTRYLDIKKPANAGDILWVRETWCTPYVPDKYAYRADYGDHDVIPNPVDNVELSANMFRWHPSIHMPKQAARIFLRVTDVHVERLQDITAAGIRAEGLSTLCAFVGDMEIALPEWRNLWNSTVKPADLEIYGWEANPWVWVIDFEQCNRPDGWFDLQPPKGEIDGHA